MGLGAVVTANLEAIGYLGSWGFGGQREGVVE